MVISSGAEAVKPFAPFSDSACHHQLLRPAAVRAVRCGGRSGSVAGMPACHPPAGGHARMVNIPFKSPEHSNPIIKNDIMSFYT